MRASFTEDSGVSLLCALGFGTFVRFVWPVRSMDDSTLVVRRRGRERKRSGNLFSCAVTVFWDFSLFPLAYDVVWSASCGGRSVFS
jgi:hypothetical protein